MPAEGFSPATRSGGSAIGSLSELATPFDRWVESPVSTRNFGFLKVSPISIWPSMSWMITFMLAMARVSGMYSWPKSFNGAGAFLPPSWEDGGLSCPPFPEVRGLENPRSFSSVAVSSFTRRPMEAQYGS